MAAAHFLSLKADSPTITKLEVAIAQNLQIPPIKFAALKCASTQTLSRVDPQVQTPCINPLRPSLIADLVLADPADKALLPPWFCTLVAVGGGGAAGQL